MAEKSSGKKRGAGRPSKFSEKLALRIFSLAQQGMTDDEIAEEVGVCRATLNNWKADKPGFLDAVRSSKAVANEIVEAALFHRAVGFRHKAIKFFFDPQSGHVYKEEYYEQYPPDTAACKMWLGNRNPKRWRDVQKHEHSGKVSLEDLVAGEESKEPEK